VESKGAFFDFRFAFAQRPLRMLIGAIMAVKRIDHIAVVVDDIDTSLTFWRDALGMDMTHLEEVKEQESIVAFLPTGGSEVELVKPTTETSGVAKYLAKRGPGMHHICLEVDNLEEMLADMKAKGVKLINETPTIGAGGKKIAFIHPSSANGVLVELYQEA
jgi:methylmalonyl-CoA/ethylmalonyl-CoA epimerase